MRRLEIAISAAVLAVGIAAPSHADEWNKLTLLTFSGPVDMPGVTLPAGTYRFELADPESGRRVVRVSEQDGSKIHGIFLSIPNQRMEPSDKPVVMFQETPSGAPQAVRAWFYPGERFGYEFVYPQDQAMKIAKATHEPVLSMKDESSPTTTDAERVATMRGTEVARIDENGRPMSADAELKESSSRRGSAEAPAAAPTTASPPPTPQPNATPAQTAVPTAQPPAPTTAAAAPRSTTAAPTAVGTSGSAAPAPARSRDELPRTASELPMVAMLGVIALAASLALRSARTA